MKIIGHTSHINKNEGALRHFLISNPVDSVEMDFRLTKDCKLVWTHNSLINGKLVSESSYDEVSELMTLEDTLEVLSGDISLLLHLKGVNGVKKRNFERLLRALEILKEYPLYSEIESISPAFIKELLTCKADLSFLDIGLIINLFTTFKYRKGNIKGLEQIDFIALSSELWEISKVGEDYKRYRELFPSAREYAWTWEKIYSEKDKRLKNYMEKDADGIITSEASLVRVLHK